VNEKTGVPFGLGVIIFTETGKVSIGYRDSRGLRVGKYTFIDRTGVREI
jgi:hypothetical protein